MGNYLQSGVDQPAVKYTYPSGIIPLEATGADRYEGRLYQKGSVEAVISSGDVIRSFIVLNERIAEDKKRALLYLTDKG